MEFTEDLSFIALLEVWLRCFIGKNCFPTNHFCRKMSHYNLGVKFPFHLFRAEVAALSYSN